MKVFEDPERQALEAEMKVVSRQVADLEDLAFPGGRVAYVEPAYTEYLAAAAAHKVLLKRWLAMPFRPLTLIRSGYVLADCGVGADRSIVLLVPGGDVLNLEQAFAVERYHGDDISFIQLYPWGEAANEGLKPEAMLHMFLTLAGVCSEALDDAGHPMGTLLARRAFL